MFKNLQGPVSFGVINIPYFFTSVAVKKKKIFNVDLFRM